MLDNSRPIVGLRRTHRKSRTGCKTCRGRHIRCDENTPICRNCERSGRQCLYVVKVKEESENPSPPYSVIYSYPRLKPTEVPPQELFLLHHLTSFTPDVQLVNNKYSSWMRNVPTMMSDHRFLLDCVLGVSAAHHSISVKGSKANQLSLYYRGRGLKGLQNALATFSESNADAVLAASIILTWYTTDWKEWSSLSHGIRTIEATMKPYKDQSAFFNIIEEQDVIPDELRPLPPTTTESPEPSYSDIADLHELIDRLQDVKQYLAGHEEEENSLNRVVEFALMLKQKAPMVSTDEQFGACRGLRVAITTMRVTLLKKIRREPRTIIVASYFYAAALAVQPLFPAMGAMFFGYIALQPLQELNRYLEDQRNDPVAGNKYNWDETAGMMAYCMETVRRFRMRLGWPSAPKSLLVPMLYSPSTSNTIPSPTSESRNLVNSKITSL